MNGIARVAAPRQELQRMKTALNTEIGLPPCSEDDPGSKPVFFKKKQMIATLETKLEFNVTEMAKISRVWQANT